DPGIRLPDARLYTSVGLRYYRAGRLVESLDEDYRVTVAATIAPAPLTINEVRSPAELAREAKLARGITYVVASSLAADAPDSVLLNGLRWLSQYDTSTAFASSGPLIMEWAQTARASTYGSEGYVPERALFTAPMSVSATAGLRELSIYDGPTLFRHIALHGKRTYRHVLMLEKTLQRDLVLVVRDRAGGVAVSHPLRSWPEGTLAPVFCSDHVNDCGDMLLARGPWSVPISAAPQVPYYEAGTTWDGGPKAVASALLDQESLPLVRTASSTFDTNRLASIPSLEAADEESVAVRTQRSSAYSDRLLKVVNPWSTLGPVERRPSRVQNTQDYFQWALVSEGATPVGWQVYGVRHGVSVSLFRNVVRFREGEELHELSFARLQPRPGSRLYRIDAHSPDSIVAQAWPDRSSAWMRRGDGFAVTHDQFSAHLIMNRGDDLEVSFGSTVELRAAGLPRSIKPGAELEIELAGHAFPVDMAVDAGVLRRYLANLDAPAGLRLLRGTRGAGAGLLDLTPSHFAIEVEAAQLSAPATLPLRITELNPRWSAGVLQKAGFSAGYYGGGSDRYRALAVTRAGTAIVPMHVERAAVHLLAGHPVVAGPEGRDLFIQVTCLGGHPMRWHVSINNPTQRAISTHLSQALELPGFDFSERQLTLQPGELVDLQ
ncbi:MAG: hypothetical protein JWN04_2736, partial [Myxococcaceae bacterium]|nr:hypothetical protein [Myxococcaceae bacterium]